MAETVSTYTPKLVIPQADSKDQRWFIKFKIWDTDKGQFVYAKDYEVSKQPLHKRNDFAKKRIADIRHMLVAGYVKGKVLFKGQLEKQRIQNTSQTLTLIKALEYGLEEKEAMNLRQIRHYRSVVKITKEWIVLAGLQRLPAMEFKPDLIKKYIGYLLSVRKVGPRTVKNYLTYVSTLLNACIESELLTENHVKKVKKPKQTVGKNWAFTPIQQKELIAYMKEFKPEWLTLIQFMYYTLARPKDLANMKVKHIGMRDPNQIYFPEEVTKEMMERNIFIPNQLKQIIKSKGLKSYPPEWYIFGADLLPSPKPHNHKNWSVRFRQNVLSKFGFKYNSNYTLYSWKHTGVVALWRAGVDENSIQRQTGHRHRYSFEKYLKSLGLFKNEAIVNRFPELE